MQIPYNTIGARIRTFLDKSGWELWLVMGFILLCGAWIWNRSAPRLSAMEQAGGHTSGFYADGVKDPYMAPQPGEYNAHQSLPLTFGLQIPTQARLVTITFKYRTLPNFRSLWLTIPAQDGSAVITLLADHALFRQLSYPLVAGEGTFLFQRQMTYATLSQFLSQPSPKTTMVADAYLTQQYERYTGKPSPFTALETYTSSSKEPDYIWTTFSRPRIFPDDWLEFSRTIDVTQAWRDEQGKIQVTLYADGMSEAIDIARPEVTYK